MKNFKCWEHPRTKAVRVYYNHGYRADLRAWFEQDPEDGETLFCVDDGSEGLSLESEREILVDELYNNAIAELAEETGQPVEALSFEDIQELGGFVRKAAKNRKTAPSKQMNLDNKNC